VGARDIQCTEVGSAFEVVVWRFEENVFGKAHVRFRVLNGARIAEVGGNRLALEFPVERLNAESDCAFKDLIAGGVDVFNAIIILVDADSLVQRVAAESHRALKISALEKTVCGGDVVDGDIALKVFGEAVKIVGISGNSIK
jgi:hypothetical protein